MEQSGAPRHAGREPGGGARAREPGRAVLSVVLWFARLMWATAMRFLDHDGWAIASHIALSILLSLFPFIIVITALASLFGSADLADRAADFLFDAWPAEVAAPIAREIRHVLTVTRSDALTIGALFAVYFSSSGIEALRIALNRAYRCHEWRPWYLTRIESIVFVLFGAIALLLFALLVVLGPVIWATIIAYAPALAPLGTLIVVLRIAIASVVIFLVLLIAHLWLAAGRRRVRDVLPGILATMVLWLVGGTVFGVYLEDFGSRGYVTTYAGLASFAVALIFLYLLGAIFIFGGELNAALVDEADAETA